jgi:hypothetical protein
MGAGGVTQVFFLFFGDCKPHLKIQIPTLIPSGIKVSVAEKEKERKKQAVVL